MLARDNCDEAAAAAIEFEEIMGKGNYFLEIRNTAWTAAENSQASNRVSEAHGSAACATNDAHYLMPEDARAHDSCSASGPAKQ